MKNSVLNWSYDKPTEPGLYLACRGDVETPENIEPLKLVEGNMVSRPRGLDWPAYSADQVAQWHSSWKFAKLCIGGEAIDESV